VAVTFGVVLAAFIAVLAISVTPLNTATPSNNSSFRLTNGTIQKTESSSVTSVRSCFLSIPADAKMTLFANSTFYGESVLYSNGTRVLFSDYSCPRPVLGGSSQGPNVYAMARWLH
jgi:hypothetical protein